MTTSTFDLTAYATKAVNTYNNAQRRVDNLTLTVAASVMLVYSDNGANKMAMRRVQAITMQMSSASVQRTVDAWVRANYDRYEAGIKLYAGMDTDARVKSLIASMTDGERTWTVIRDEHKATSANKAPNKAAKVENVSGDKSGEEVKTEENVSGDKSGEEVKTEENVSGDKSGEEVKTEENVSEDKVSDEPSAAEIVASLIPSLSYDEAVAALEQLQAHVTNMLALQVRAEAA